MSEWRFWLARQRGTLLAMAIFVVMFTIYCANHPAGFSANVVQTASNKGVLLAFVAMAQSLVVITSGIDLSVGMIFTLTNCLASAIVIGSPLSAGLGVVAVLAVGALCGAINGLIVIFGRLQPIVATIASGAVYFGLALALRPTPGGSVNETLADAFTGRLFDVLPASLLALVAVVLVVWVPFSRSVTGRAAYAVGSSEPAAYMSGVPIRRAKFAAYTLSGLLAGSAGCSSLFSPIRATRPTRAATPIRCFRSRRSCWAASRCLAAAAAPIGAIFGALAFRTIGDLLFVFDFDPLWQPLFQGVVLLLAVSLGAFGLLRVRNRLEWFG